MRCYRTGRPPRCRANLISRRGHRAPARGCAKRPWHGPLFATAPLLRKAAKCRALGHISAPRPVSWTWRSWGEAGAAAIAGLAAVVRRQAIVLFIFSSSRDARPASGPRFCRQLGAADLRGSAMADRAIGLFASTRYGKTAHQLCRLPALAQPSAAYRSFSLAAR